MGLCVLTCSLAGHSVCRPQPSGFGSEGTIPLSGTRWDSRVQGYKALSASLHEL